MPKEFKGRKYEEMSDAEKAEYDKVIGSWTDATLECLRLLLLIRKNFGREYFQYYINDSSTPHSYKVLWQCWQESRRTAMKKFKIKAKNALGKRKVKPLGF